jgi:hypothetical protein
MEREWELRVATVWGVEPGWVRRVSVDSMKSCYLLALYSMFKWEWERDANAYENFA